jgi:hypothetical protein
VFTRIIRWIVDDAHGGCLVILPSGATAQSADLKIRYEVTGTDEVTRTSLSQTLSRLWEACAAGHTATNRAEAQEACRREDWCWQRTLTTAEVMRRAAAVDGCAVLSRALGLLGFGAEILTRDADLPDNRRVLFDADSGEELPLERALERIGGTRHRSALRICTKIAGAVAIVVSQDSDLTVLASDDQRTSRYAHLQASELDLSPG